MATWIGHDGGRPLQDHDRAPPAGSIPRDRDTRGPSGIGGLSSKKAPHLTGVRRQDQRTPLRERSDGRRTLCGDEIQGVGIHHQWLWRSREYLVRDLLGIRRRTQTGAHGHGVSSVERLGQRRGIQSIHKDRLGHCGLEHRSILRPARDPYQTGA